jgi:hypothetical protein
MTALTRNTDLPICALALLLAGCSASSSLERSFRTTVPDLQLHAKGDEHFVTSKDGNLIGSTVFSSEERVVQVEDFINNHRSDFGIATGDTLQFVKAGPEFDFQFGDRLLTAVPILQSINGMRILDREQLGVFDLESGQLKAVKIAVTDPAPLKKIPLPIRRDNIQSLAAKFLETQGIVSAGMTVSDNPAYSLALGMSGFEVRCTANPNSLFFTRVRLLVNTDDGMVAFLSKEEIDVPQ